MGPEFSLGMFKKIRVKDGYLIVDKGKTTVKLADITDVTVVKKSVVLSRNNIRLASFDGLSTQTAFQLIEFINSQRGKIQAQNAPPTRRRGKINQFLLTLTLAIIIVAVIVAVYFFISTP